MGVVKFIIYHVFFKHRDHRGEMREEEGRGENRIRQVRVRSHTIVHSLVITNSLQYQMIIMVNAGPSDLNFRFNCT